MSSSDNKPTFHVKLRGLSADFTEIGPHLGELDLGELTAPQLIELLTRFASIDPMRLIDDEPKIDLQARRGRFIARSMNGKVLLQSSGIADAGYVEFAPEEVPDWLDQPEGMPLGAGTTVSAPAAHVTGTSSGRTKRLGVTILMVVSLAGLGLSLFWTFQPTPLHPPDAFSPIVDEQALTRWQQVLPGRFVTGAGDSELRINANGTLDYLEIGASPTATEHTTDSFQILNMHGVGPVLKAENLGPIVLRNPDTLAFNGEDYLRARR